jgi:hypothetical protein
MKTEEENLQTISKIKIELDLNDKLDLQLLKEIVEAKLQNQTCCNKSRSSCATE